MTSTPAAEYHLDPCATPSLSKSIARILCTQSPAHAWHAHPRLNPNFEPEERDIFDLGTVAHAVLLEGQAAVELVDAPDWRTAAAKEQRDDARARGLVPILKKQWDPVIAMVTAAREQLAVHAADPTPFAYGVPEQMVVWEDEGVLCRCLIDWLHANNVAISDYKTTSRSADPATWSKSLFSTGCDIQAYVYARAVEAISGDRPAFRFVVQENYPPFALSVLELGEDVLTIGRKKWEYARELWRKCLDRDEWPAYPQRVATAGLPAYEEARWLEKETAEVGVGA